MSRLIQRFRFLIDHRWSPGQMSEYLDGELGPSARDRLERHSHDCPRCRELLRTLRATVAALAALGSEPSAGSERTVAQTLLVGFRQRLEAEGGHERHR